jgi:NAD(P)-dependent dehydrogenase (short-subunit alcohol dehydrogenase family)
VTQVDGSGRLSGKIAVVTGAAQGIGRAITRALASEGASVVAADRNADELENTARLAPGDLVTQVCDVTDADSVRQLVATAEERFGALHVMVNNAAVAYAIPLIEMSEEDWDATMNTNVKGAFFGCKYAIPAMIRAGGGSVINMGSVNSFLGEKLSAAYVTSKGAILMLTKNAACEYAEVGVRVNAICPGATDTPMQAGFLNALGDRELGERWMSAYQPLTGLLDPDDVASVAVFLASDESRGMTGAAVTVDGGLSASWDHGPGPLEYVPPPRPSEADRRPAAA